MKKDDIKGTVSRDFLPPLNDLTHEGSSFICMYLQAQCSVIETTEFYIKPRKVYLGAKLIRTTKKSILKQFVSLG